MRKFPKPEYYDGIKITKSELIDIVKNQQSLHRSDLEYIHDLKSHLKILSQAILDDNRSAAIQFAIQSEGIINRYVL